MVLELRPTIVEADTSRRLSKARRTKRGGSPLECGVQRDRGGEVSTRNTTVSVLSSYLADDLSPTLRFILSLAFFGHVVPSMFRWP